MPEYLAKSLKPLFPGLFGFFSLVVDASPLLSLSLILQVPENIAPDSIESFEVTMSPRIFEDAFKLSKLLTMILPSIKPETSEFLQITSPLTFPVGPMTTLPFVLRFPLRDPSIRISPLDLISPVISVPLLIRLILYYLFRCTLP